MKRKLLTITVLAMAAVAAYAMAGFLIAPRVLERKLQSMVREDTDLDLVAETVAVNPFTLTLSLDNVTLFRPENTPVVSIDRLEGRVRSMSFREPSLTVHDVVIGSLAVADGRHEQPLLVVPAIAAQRVILGWEPVSMTAESLRLDQPGLRLYRDETGKMAVPDSLSRLLRALSAAGDSGPVLEISNGNLVFLDLVFLDKRLSAPLRLHVSGIEGAIKPERIGSDPGANVSLRGRLTEGGTAELNVDWVPAKARGYTRVELALEHVDMPAISPYVAAVTTRGVTRGRMDMTLRATVEEAMLEIDSETVIESLAFEQAVHRELALVMALLEDRAGTLRLRVPVEARRLDGETDIAGLYAAALTGYLARLASTPFDYLADIAGQPETDLGKLPFAPGSAEIRGDAMHKIAALARALEMRPKLALTVFPGLDPDADREALARQQIVLHVNWATSAGVPGQPATKPIDFDDLIVRSVLDEFAANRLPRARQAALIERLPARDASYYRAVFEALVDNESVAVSALERLARYRAQSVVDELRTSDDDAERVRAAGEIRYTEPGSPTVPQVLLEASRDDR